MAALRGTLDTFTKAGNSGSEVSRLAGGSIEATLNTWGVRLRVHLNREGRWRFQVEDYKTGEQHLCMDGDNLTPGTARDGRGEPLAINA